ncbi:YihY/virulence factor BrkB family protein [Litorimonas taeanensis]|uniref:YihY/virulence factor BrkB family protein n=1 Tax=Litorimonas taeanensis TaxID=568099 RepID=UPI000EAC4E4E|nr:YihY/virulence factor BrkB family protein [Litorimonas taeanensis]
MIKALSKFEQNHHDSPYKFGLADWWAVIKRTYISAQRDNVSVVAAGVAFFSLIAVFPLISAAISIFGYFANPQDADEATQIISALMPGQAFDVIQNQIVTVVDAPNQAMGWGIAISLSVAIFSAGAGIRAMMRAMNIAYQEIEKRNFFVFYAYAILMTLGSFLVIWLSLLLIVGIPAALIFINLESSAEFAARSLPWLLLFAVFAFATGVMYRFGPSRRPAKKRWLSPGIILATTSWLLISYGFSKFVSEFGNYNATYGSLSAVVILLVWLWLTATVIIFGAELNSELERQTIADTTRGPARPLGRRGASVADFKATETKLEEATAEILNPQEATEII